MGKSQRWHCGDIGSSSPRARKIRIFPTFGCKWGKRPSAFRSRISIGSQWSEVYGPGQYATEVTAKGIAAAVVDAMTAKQRVEPALAAKTYLLLICP